MHILLIADTDIHRLFSELPNKNSFRIIIAANKKDALSLLIKQPFELVLIDLELEATLGLELLKSIRERFLFDELPIIVLSAPHDEAVISSAIDFGATDFILKPLKTEELSLKLRNMQHYRKISARNDMLTNRLRRVEKELYETKAIINHSPTIAFIWENKPGWPVSFVTENVLSLFGYSAQEFLSQKVLFSSCIHPDDIDRVATEVEQFENKKNSSSLEHSPYRIISKNGDVRWILDFSTVERNSAGEVVHFKGIVQDITERKLFEEKQLESDQRLDVFFKQSLDGFFFMLLDAPVIWDDTVDKEQTLDYVFSHQRVTRINDAMLSQYRTTREYFIGLTPNEIFAHDIEQGRKVWRQFFDEGKLHIDTTEKRFDGSNMVVTGDYICMYDSEGRITGHFGVQRDVTQERAALAQLKENESQLRQITDNMTDVVWTSDLELNTIYVSPSVKKVLGYTQHEFKNSPVERRFPPSAIAIISKLLQEELLRDKDPAIDKNRSRIVEIEQYHADGRLLPFSAHTRFLRNENDQPVGLQGVTREISELKAAEKTIRESEERFKKLSSLTFEGILIFENNVIVDTNEAFTRLSGYTRDEIVGKDIIPIMVNGTDRAFLYEKLNKFGDELIKVEGIKKDGTRIPVEIESRTMMYKGGAMHVTAIRDISYRTLAEKALLETNSNNEFLSYLSYQLSAFPEKDVIKNIALPLIKDHTGADYAHFSFYNKERSMLALEHIEADNTILNAIGELVGKDIFKTISPVNEEAYKRITRGEIDVMETLTELSFGVIPPFVDKVLRKATGLNYFYAFAQMDEDELYGVTVLAFKNINSLPTEELLRSFNNILSVSIHRKQIEEQLRLSQEKQKTIINTVPDLLFHMDKCGRFIDFYQPLHTNELYKQPDEFLTKTVADVFDKQLADRMQMAINKTFKLGKYEFEYDLKEDEHRYFYARLAKLNENEVLSVVSDITEQKRIEEQLRNYSHDLENLNATKDRLFSIIGHDLKNPLNNIIGFSQLLENRLRNVDDKKTVLYNQLVYKSAIAVSELLENLLIWSRAQRHQLQVNPKLLGMRKIAEEAVALLKPSASDKGLVIENNIDPIVTAYADQSMISTIIRNFISNAIKFTAKGGKVSVYSTTTKQRTTIAVQDTGVGIPPDKLPLLFKVGEHYTIEGTKGESGTGLGLIICKEFAQLSNGRIWAESDYGKGSKFMIELPRHRK
ncbi:MAG: PAS domain S-box protein [Salinivirgaceae bacterium]|jgi:PAS domain S-box-containing protein|nr:PAS domain S-box protein [Salinivirgaceae bacterium]